MVFKYFNNFLMIEEKNFMILALKLARRAKGLSHPNPAVGAVLVKNGRIVGQGSTQPAGSTHAEIVAIKKAGSEARGATLFVTLEPCCIWGKNPPCSDAIIRAGIKKVVLAIKDPNPRINGRGVSQLQSAGIKIEYGLGESEARFVNEDFFKFIKSGLPFVTLKAAQTLDGFIATTTGHSKWISDEGARRFVHQLRAESDAIVVGWNTIRLDDPHLTTRYGKGKNAHVIILDPRLRSSPRAQIFNKIGGRTVCLAVARGTSLRKQAIFRRKGIEILSIQTMRDGIFNLKKVLEYAVQREWIHLLVEGGSRTFTHFAKQKIVDKVHLFMAHKIMGAGIKVFQDLGIRAVYQSLMLKEITLTQFKKTVLFSGYPVF